MRSFIALSLSLAFPLIAAQDVRPGLLVACTQPSTFALTFDDGPSPYTARLLDILAAESVIATFFVLGSAVANPAYHSVLKSAYDAGHQIAVHTYSHPYLSTLSASDIESELSRTTDAIYDVLNKNPNYMRPPFGECSLECQRVVESAGYVIIQWNLDSNDWRVLNQSRMYKQVLAAFVNEMGKGLKTGYISLQHDTHAFSVGYVKEIIDVIRKHGYRFVTVAECTGNPKPMYREGGGGNTTAVETKPTVPAVGNTTQIGSENSSLGVSANAVSGWVNMSGAVWAAPVVAAVLYWI